MTKKTYTILLVDDTPANLDLLMQELLQKNYRVLVAESGHSALQRIKHVEPDLILLDVIMPDMNGFETCRQIKAFPNFQKVPVLFLSALDETIDKVRGFEAGGVDYIVKPVDNGEVLSRIHTHLQLRELQQQLEQQNKELEDRVRERTAKLQKEIVHRQKQEEQKQKLLEILERQSDQLRDLTTWLIKNNTEQQAGIAQSAVPQLMLLIKQILQQIEISETVALSLQNSTERFQMASPLQQIRSSTEQLQTDVQNIGSRFGRSLPELRKKLDDPLLKLSARERQVMQLIVDGNSNTQIAALLHLSEVTVRSHRRRLLQKLRLADTTALIKFAVKHDITALR